MYRIMIGLFLAVCVISPAHAKLEVGTYVGNFESGALCRFVVKKIIHNGEKSYADVDYLGNALYAQWTFSATSDDAEPWSYYYQEHVTGNITRGIQIVMPKNYLPTPQLPLQIEIWQSNYVASQQTSWSCFNFKLER